MPAREGYGETKVRNSPAPSKGWVATMDRAMANRKKKKKKAGKILKHGSIRGKKLTTKQQKFFGAMSKS